MKGQNLWIVLLVGLHTVSVFCKNNTDEIDSENQNGTEIYGRDVQMFSSDGSERMVLLPLVLSLVAVPLLLFLIGCFCYKVIRKCGRQSRNGGLILSSGGNQETNGVHIAQQQVVQQAHPLTNHNYQYFPLQNQPMQQPQYLPIHQLPPLYPLTQQRRPHNNPMQQFPSQNQPMQQFPPQNYPMQQFLPQQSPMQESSPQNQPMQQFLPQQSPMQQSSLQNQPMQQFLPRHSPMQQSSSQNQPMQQFLQQHSPMQQFQGSVTTSQPEIAQESEVSSNIPPQQENDLP